MNEIKKSSELLPINRIDANYVRPIKMKDNAKLIRWMKNLFSDLLIEFTVQHTNHWWKAISRNGVYDHLGSEHLSQNSKLVNNQHIHLFVNHFIQLIQRPGISKVQFRHLMKNQPYTIVEVIRGQGNSTQSIVLLLVYRDKKQWPSKNIVSMAYTEPTSNQNFSKDSSLMTNLEMIMFQMPV